MEYSQPFISVITVVFNAEKHIERTLLSIINQFNVNVEYIIVDGASTDNTPKIIEKYKSHIKVYLSEPDKGLYDAMNKGLKLASGKYVWFINAGDEIAGQQTIDKLLPFDGKDILYSDTIVIDENAEELGLLSQLTHNNAPDNLNWKMMKKGMVVCHQSFIVKKEMAPFFDTKYRLSSDINWVIECLKKAKNTQKVNTPLSKFMRAGLSKQKINQAMKERYFILKYHFGFWPNLVNHLFLVFRFLSSGRKSKLS